MNYYEITYRIPGEQFPRFILTTDDARKAVTTAARHDHAEIIAWDDVAGISVSVYSDDFAGRTNRWFEEEVRNARARLADKPRK